MRIKQKYIILFRGDSSDFEFNQEILLYIKAGDEVSFDGMTAEFSLLGNIQRFDSIPNDRVLHLQFPASVTSSLPLGPIDGRLVLYDSTGARRTASNRVRFVITNRVPEAYFNEDPNAITVIPVGGGYVTPIMLDNAIDDVSLNLNSSIDKASEDANRKIAEEATTRLESDIKIEKSISDLSSSLGELAKEVEESVKGSLEGQTFDMNVNDWGLREVVAKMFKTFGGTVVNEE